MTSNVYNKNKSQWVSSGAIKSNRKDFFKKKYFERGHWQSKIFYIDGDRQGVYKKNTFRYYFDVFDKKGIKQPDMPLSYVQTQLHILNKTPGEILKDFFYYLNK